VPPKPPELPPPGRRYPPLVCAAAGGATATIRATGANHGGANVGRGAPATNVRHIRTGRSVRPNLGYFIARTGTGYAV
jgi:hypothetical protein